jgi:hypothetical protein
MKVTELTSDSITFENGVTLTSHHDSDCCESHWLSFNDLKLEDFQGLEFDLSNDNFFERVEDYGIRLLPINGHPVSVPGYGSNNGYYSSDLHLIISDGRSFDISNCQVISG